MSSALLAACVSPGLERHAAPHRYGCAAEGVELSAGDVWQIEFPCVGVADPARSREHGDDCCATDWTFDEALPSWNVDVPAGASFRVEVRVEVAGRAAPSPWLDIGGWGAWPAEDLAPTTFADGAVEVDLLRCARVCTRARFRLRTRELAAGEVLRVARFGAVFTRSQELAGNARFVEEQRAASPALGGPGRVAHASAADDAPATWPARLRLVPLRHQYAEGPELGPRVCSPTSVAMVLDAHGVDVPTREVAALLYDGEHDLYGNWNRAVQGAYLLGVPGRVTRLATWFEAASLLDHAGPLVISIAAEEGQLRGAPYTRTGGHLMVLVGFDLETDEALVLDPATPVGDEAPRRYALDDLETVWLARGGFAYVLGR
ncbi:MAG: C39 family peptidase [Planctomycetes bacterium]|nr:C39 family peptidase [Planctomycetota bacterium]